MSEVIETALWRHRGYDGSGYGGDGRDLRGEDIPLLARIVAVADYYVANLEDRPYRPGRIVSEVCEELRLLAGSRFDYEPSRPPWSCCGPAAREARLWP